MIAFPSLMVWEVSSSLFHREQERISREMMSNTLRQNMLNIDNQIDIAIATCYNIAFDPTLIRYLRFARNGSLNDAEILDVLFYLNKFITNYEAINHNAEIAFYLDFPELLTRNRDRFRSIEDVPEYILEPLVRRDIATLVLAPSDYVSRGSLGILRKYYTLVQSVSGITPSQGLLALVAARIEVSTLHRIIDDITLDPKSYVCFHDNEKIFFIRRGEQEVQAPPGMELNDLNRDYLDIGGERYAIFKARSAKTGWELTALISQDSFLGVARRVVLITFVFALLFAVLIGSISIRYFDRITRRLEELSGGMKMAAQGNYNTFIIPDGDREIRTIQTSYNTMISTIKTLIEDHYQQQIKIQTFELKALENQIKPHFLYNTLDVIKFKALRSGADEVASNLEEMARYFRIVLAGGRRFFTVLDEVDQCRLYVQLQNFRRDSIINFETDTPEETAFCTILRFLLQPLIENAIVHGIRGKPDRSGKVTITTRREGDCLLIRVIDDGVGMPAEVLKSLPGESQRNMGASNIHSRIQVFYGPSYGLSFPWSNEGGTCAELRLPFKLDESYIEHDIDPAEPEKP
ncbi:hypothetical protein FACS1894110_25810 [Spirochaetia bacterium]|nr:hypothetical protein FACS1894110_25810 [Spirochaetia bacterium]